MLYSAATIIQAVMHTENVRFSLHSTIARAWRQHNCLYLATSDNVLALMCSHCTGYICVYVFTPCVRAQSPGWGIICEHGAHDATTATQQRLIEEVRKHGPRPERDDARSAGWRSQFTCRHPTKVQAVGRKDLASSVRALLKCITIELDAMRMRAH